MIVFSNNWREIEQCVYVGVDIFNTVVLEKTGRTNQARMCVSTEWFVGTPVFCITHSITKDTVELLFIKNGRKTGQIISLKNNCFEKTEICFSFFYLKI